MAKNEMVFRNLAETAKYLDETGLLFEINRKILHPVSLSLIVQYPDNDTTKDPIGLSLMDSSDQESVWGGFAFDVLTLLKEVKKHAKFMEEFGDGRIATRKRVFGSEIQSTSCSLLSSEVIVDRSQGVDCVFVEPHKTNI